MLPGEKSSVKDEKSDGYRSNYCRRDFLPFKFYYFFLFGAIGCVVPYVSVFFKMLGLDALKIGIISGVRPLIAFLTAVFWGVVVDKFKIRRYVFLGSIACWGVFFFSLYMLPLPPMNRTCDRAEQVQFGRTASGRDAHLLPAGSIDRKFYSDPAFITDSTDPDHPSDLSAFKTRGARSKLFGNSSDRRFYLKSRNDGSLETTKLFTSSLGRGSTTSSAAGLDPWTETRTVRGVLIPPNLTSTTIDWTDDEVSFLRENLGWLYKDEAKLTIFILCLFLVAFGEICQPPASFLADAACFDLIAEKSSSEYPQHRAYGALGWALLSLLLGALLAQTRTTVTLCGVAVTFSDYRVGAVVFLVAISFAFVSGLFVPFKSKDEGNEKAVSSVNNIFAVLKLFLNMHYGSWLFCIFLMGFCNGIIWGFLFWHLENIGATQLLLGIDSFLTFIVEFVVFHLSRWAISKLGHIGVMYLSLVCYVARFLIYGLIANPWFALIADTLQGFTFSICWSSFAEYGTSAVPPAYSGCILGIVHGTYFGAGNGLGHLMGGVLVQYIGARITFCAMAAACAVFVILFFIVQRCFPKSTTSKFDYEEMVDTSERNGFHSTDSIDIH